MPSARTTSLIEVAAVAGIVAVASIGEGPYIPLFAAVLIVCLSYERGIVAKGLNAGWCLWLGKISFSVYLIHEEIIGLLWPRFPASRLPFGHDANGIVWTVMVLAIVLAIATVTWLCIEEPFRRLGSWLARRIERYQPESPPHQASAPPQSAAVRITSSAAERPAAG
jgi:peptidoglycan/LPS O-acetylase OafA/YrhL